nr:MAG TPA: hypothetical protein [Caudoviricetes sp.]
MARNKKTRIPTIYSIISSLIEYLNKELLLAQLGLNY